MTVPSMNQVKITELLRILTDMTGLSAGFYSRDFSTTSQFQSKMLSEQRETPFDCLYSRVGSVECFLYDKKKECYYFSLWIHTLKGFFITGAYYTLDTVPSKCIVELEASLHYQEKGIPFKERHNYVRTMTNSMVRHYFYYYPGGINGYDWITRLMEEEGMDYVYHPYEKEKEFLDYFKKMDTEGFEMLQELEENSDMTFGADNSIRDAKNQLIVLCSILARPLIETGITSSEVMTLNKHFLSAIENKDSMYQLNQLKKEILDSFYYLMKKESDKKYTPMVRQIREFVHCRLRKPLDVKMVAEHMNLTPGYISTVFKREYGVSLKRYILELKVEEAERLVLYSDKKLSDIAVMLCFNDQTYFTKVFKRIKGRTPKQFRKERPPIS
ncbi:helix-turn-helix domain-containing protein [Salibacterium sp. K-3]